MEEAKGPDLTIRYLTNRVLTLNVSAGQVSPDVVSLYVYNAEMFRFRG